MIINLAELQHRACCCEAAALLVPVLINVPGGAAPAVHGQLQVSSQMRSVPGWLLLDFLGSWDRKHHICA